MPLGLEFKGARTIEGPMTVVDIWQLLHTDAKEWRQVPRNSNFFKIREMLDDADRDALQKLHAFEADHWEHLCFGAGWTIIGAVALSWCNDATLERVVDAWRNVDTKIKPDAPTLRAAGMLCPRLLPESKRLSEIIATVERDAFTIALIIAAHDGNVETDLDDTTLSQAPDTLIPMLSYALQKSENDTKYAALLSEWELTARK